ncbi:DUF4365 domain-containing protein (plasmid) [Agrobacterium rosae]|uniref:DUF4365 domain-containing protein n=1 Tax=Agrobacterium rosae TaxID=1972867 RepID=A0ABU4W1Q3_9HYPH|nr:DUF4365 domain-containing protein [Agrobacterium rosae]MCM2435636.1 DUF4365 domain-containing protein [Agrobacterium rosae]MDX8331703.1 DUF4365 domain-containing protein [Agrobacterium rosae]
MSEKISDAALPELGQNAVSGQLGETQVEAAVLQLGLLYQRRAGLDFGIDGTIELVTDGDRPRATGRQIAVQVKRGASNVRKTRYGRTLYVTEQHANYWLGHSLPVIVVHCEPDTGRLRWQHVATAALRPTKNGFAIDFPEDSDLCRSLTELRSLAERATTKPAIAEEKALILTYDPHTGILVGDEELGIAALSITRAVLRGEKARIFLEVEGESELIASIDAIRDMTAPTTEQRKDAIIREDVLSTYRRHSQYLHRAITFLLTDPTMIEHFGYQDCWLAAAIKNIAGPIYGRRTGQGIQLDAWPGAHLEYPVVRFAISQSAMEEFYNRESTNRTLIKMGSAGGVVVTELSAETVATRYFPALVQRMIAFADQKEADERKALEDLGVNILFWQIGLA